MMSKLLSIAPKINMEPENDGLEDDFLFPGVYSRVPAVRLPGCTQDLLVPRNRTNLLETTT